MTIEEIIEKAKQIQWSPYSLDYVEFVNELAELKPEQLPSNLDEAAKKYASKNLMEANLQIPAFKAGARWMAEQGVNLEATIENHPELVRNSGDHHLLVVEKIDETTNKLPEGKYIIQIRKAE